MEVSASSPIDRPEIGRQKDARKSRVTNGSDLLPGIDGRSIVARRYRDIAGAILVDQGGIDQCSESRKQLIRRFAAAAVLAEQMEAKLARGEEIDISEHALLCSTLIRVGQRIGIDRVPKDVSPSLADYLASNYAPNAADTPAGVPEGEAVLEAVREEPRADMRCPECGGSTRVLDADQLLLECRRCGTRFHPAGGGSHPDDDAEAHDDR